MKTIFFGEDGRIRSGWRAVTFLIAFSAIAFAAVFASMIALSQLRFGETAAGYLPLLLPFGVSAIVAIVLGWLFGKFFEQLPFAVLGISFTGRWAKHTALGCGIGALAIGSAVLIAVMGGGISVSLNQDSSTGAIATSLLTTFVIFAVGALSEETLFRGYLLQTFIRSRVPVVGIVFTSLLFSAAHNSNPGVNWISAVNTVLAGVWFAFAYMKYRDIWFPFGIHLMWNWLQGPVLGINVSGISDFSPDPVLRSADNGPAILTGGSYGIEGGLACTIAIAISIALLYFLPGLKPGEEIHPQMDTDKHR